MIDDSLPFTTNETSPAIHRALALMRRAHDIAKEDGVRLWDYAIEIRSLRECGLMDTDLRWLIVHGYVEHRVETTRLAFPQRTFREVKNLAFYGRTCCVLTENGVSATTNLDSQPADEWNSSGKSSSIPKWDAELRVLFLGSQTVKEFRRPAPNQEAILSAFHEQLWARRIDDPLPPKPGLDSRSRFHDSIKSLNRDQLTPLIRFRGDGSGKGVFWDFGADKMG